MKQLRPGLALVLFAALVLGLAGAASNSASAAATSQTGPGCSGTTSPSLTEGPYYKSGSPERTNLLQTDIPGTKLVLTGYVYGKNCQPIAHAWLDFWQADGNGAYDNAGYKLRGYQYTDASGKYQLTTVVPGEYPGRTVHIHVKVQAPGGQVLTTQLFMPNVARNSTDSIYDPALLMSVQDTLDGKTATYNFVLNSTAAQAANQSAAQATPMATLPPQPTPTLGPRSSVTFRETGETVSGLFFLAWTGNRSYSDSLYLNGVPITSARDEVSPTDGKTYLTQWFERARFEMHPENQAPNNVLLGLLGVSAAKGRQSETPFKPVANPGGSVQWFSATGHTLGDSSKGGQVIASFWTRLGGLAQFGFPISQPFTEVSKDDGKSYLVQYFQRQRLEYHPENTGTNYEILLGRLGAEQVKK